ncbi:MAG: hypothetical protein WCX69_02985 [Candidatus Paceibacterota bacterium]
MFNNNRDKEVAHKMMRLTSSLSDMESCLEKIVGTPIPRIISSIISEEMVKMACEIEKRDRFVSSYKDLEYNTFWCLIFAADSRNLVLRLIVVSGKVLDVAIRPSGCCFAVEVGREGYLDKISGWLSKLIETGIKIGKSA